MSGEVRHTAWRITGEEKKTNMTKLRYIQLTKKKKNKKACKN